MPVIFSQPPDPAGLTHVANTVDQNLPGFPPLGPGGTRIMADDFILAAPSAIGLIRFWGSFLFDSPPSPPPDLAHVHLTIYPDLGPGVGPEIFIADLGPIPGTPYIEIPFPPLTPPPGYFFDALAPISPANPTVPASSILWMYDCPVSVPVLPPGTYWLGVSVDLVVPPTTTGAGTTTPPPPHGSTFRFGWSSAAPGPHPASPSTCAFSATPFTAPAPTPSWVPFLYPPGGPGPVHPFAGTPMSLAFELESPVTTTIPGTTTVPVTGTTTPPPAPTTTGPAGTTTAPGPTTTAPPLTTAPGSVPHPADTTVGGLSGNSNFRISSTEILAYAAAFLDGDAAKFPGVTVYRSAYVLRAAAIFLANFQARYEDVGTTEPVDDPTHPARWQELPDI